jgi:ATP phosphoribosyltransferase regulatory subunit
MPPFIEHIESLLTGAGHDLDLQTFKLVDQVSGRTLGVRADMTPQVARIDAHQLNRDVPTRLCYIGTVLRTRADSFGGSRSPLQVGAELYGHSGVESDVEVLGLMLNTFNLVGVDDVYLDLGNVDIFRSLAKQAGLSAEQEAQLFTLMQKKAVPEINELLAALAIDGDMKSMLSALANLNGGIDVIATARQVLAKAGGEVQAAIDHLAQVADKTLARFGDMQLHFDLAELSGYHYQTGVVFAAFVPQSGQAIARGGRYDDIGAVFGRARAATGFSADLKALVQLSARQAVTLEKVFAPASDDTKLHQAIEQLREQGVVVVEQLPGQSADASAMGCSRSFALVDGEWKVSE